MPNLSLYTVACTQGSWRAEKGGRRKDSGPLEEQIYLLASNKKQERHRGGE